MVSSLTRGYGRRVPSCERRLLRSRQDWVLALRFLVCREGVTSELPREFRARYERRRPLYEAAADFVAHDVDDLVLAAGGIHVEAGSLARLGELVPGEGRSS